MSLRNLMILAVMASSFVAHALDCSTDFREANEFTYEDVPDNYLRDRVPLYINVRVHGNCHCEREFSRGLERRTCKEHIDNRVRSLGGWDSNYSSLVSFLDRHCIQIYGTNRGRVARKKRACQAAANYLRQAAESIQASMGNPVSRYQGGAYIYQDVSSTTEPEAYEARESR